MTDDALYLAEFYKSLAAHHETALCNSSVLDVTRHSSVCACMAAVCLYKHISLICIYLPVSNLFYVYGWLKSHATQMEAVWAEKFFICIILSVGFLGFDSVAHERLNAEGVHRG